MTRSTRRGYTDDEKRRILSAAQDGRELTTLEKGQLILIEIDAALARGTKHYNRAGELVEDRKAILECILDEGGITFEPASN